MGNKHGLLCKIIITGLIIIITFIIITVILKKYAAFISDNIGLYRYRLKRLKIQHKIIKITTAILMKKTAHEITIQRALSAIRKN